MRRRTVIALSLAAALFAMTGCTKGIGAGTLTPKLSPPDIARAGVLRAAVDLSLPPFAGSVKGQQVGIDVDVASAIAEQIGLKLELVNAKPAAAAALVSSGSVDIVLGALTVESAVSSQIAFAGTYLSDAPAVFAAKTAAAATNSPAAAPAPVSVDDLAGYRIAVQGGSLAYWALLDTYGEAPLVVVESLDEAFKAVAGGTADIAAGDALIGVYMVRGYPTLEFAGQIGSAYPLGVGVSQSKPKLESQVRAILDKLASQDVLETLRRKWFGDLAPLQVTSAPGSDDATPALETSPTP